MQVVVLNDGETFTDISGCVIVDVPDEMDTEDIEMYLREGEWDGLDIKDVLAVYKAVKGFS